MGSKELRISQVEGTRMCLVKNAVKDLFKVTIIEKDTCKHANNNVVSESYNKLHDTETQSKEAVFAARLSAAQKSLSWTTLCFEGDVSLEDIKNAKSFVSIHLSPNPEYTTSTHKLENQQEFNMVLESAHNIQTSTMALVTFDTDCREVTLQGSPSNVASARSRVVMILDKLREQGRTDCSFNSDNSKSYDEMKYDLFLSNFIEKQNNNDTCVLSHGISNAQTPNEVTNLKQFKSQERHQNNNDRNVAGLAHKNTFSNIPLSQLEENSSDDIDCDATLSPTKLMPVKLDYSAYFEPSSSSEEDSSHEEFILEDPRFSKKIEQALKLGYSEKHVMKALARLGPECQLNDLLSALIKLGTTDVDPSWGQSLSSEIDTDFSLHGVIDLKHHKLQKLNATRSESGDISSFSSSADSHRSANIDVNDSSNLRHIIIDGSNVAMSHGKKAFSCKGIQIAVSWFRERGHKNITAFVPQWRKETSRADAPITDQEILSNLEKEGVVVFTPARRVKGRRVVCYDDRYILKLAVETDGIVVSNDVYRDLVSEREDFRMVVEQRLLMYSFVNDRFMPPEDPLGRLGPTLDNFLRKVPAEPTPKPQDCPYGKKCTYGNKCRFYHPERGFAPQKLITETLKERADLKLQERATRLSEITEKGKRSKQKLSRTKSLVPGEPLPSQPAGKGKHEKPKLAHSKSLVFPTKSSDYLNEPRKKLEEAELSAAMEKMSAQDSSFMQQFPAQVFSLDDSAKISKSKPPSSRSSPVLQKDVTKHVVALGDNTLKNSFTVKSISTNPSRASPSHLTVPQPEQPERYLSGHLYLAKKLSDESVESSFFSEHTSSPSSTRTSSPIVSANKTMEHKQIPPLDIFSKNRQDGHSESFTIPPPYHPFLVNQQVKYSSQPGHHDPSNIPNLSIFDQGVSHHSQGVNSIDVSLLYMYEGTEGTQFTDYPYQKVNPLSPDSGLCTSSESILSPYQTQPEYSVQMSRPYPLFTAEQSVDPQEHLNLRRAFSSTGNFKTADDLHQKLGRRASGYSSTQYRDEHQMIKPQSMPVSHQFGQQVSLNRQNSSSDPQVHTLGAGELHDLSSLFSGGDSGSNFKDQYSSYIQNQQRPIESQQRLQHPQQQNNFLLNPQQQKQKIKNWSEKSNYTHQPSPGSAAQNFYSPFQQNPLSPHITNHPSQYPVATVPPSLMASVPYNRNTHHQHLPSVQYQTQFDPLYPSARRQSVPTHSNYQPQYNIIPNNQAFGYTAHQQFMPSNQSASMPYISHEDAPILPEDPRYTIYYHLSNVFTEQVVRRVMNLNPTELNPDYLCKLIIKYKEDTGL